MNKLFTKIATACVGLVMAVGVGVAVGSGSSAPREARADSYTIWFDGAATTSTTAVTTNNLLSTFGTKVSTYVQSVSATGYCYPEASDSIKFGSSSKAGSFALTLKTDYQVNATSVDFYIKSYGSDATKVKLMGESTSRDLTSNASFVKYTYTYASATKVTSISFTAANASKCRGYIQKIVVNYGTATNDVSLSEGSHGTLTGDTSIATGGSGTVTIVPDTGYKLPSSVTSVDGATLSSYNSSNGQVALTSVTGAVTIHATCPALTNFTITVNETNCSHQGDSTILEKTGSATITFIPSEGYGFPDSVTVTGATQSWTKSTGTLVLTAATAAPVVTISCPVVILSSIEVTKATTSFYYGHAFEHETAVVTATYSDGSHRDVTESATFSEPNMFTTGEQTITVTYGGQSDSYTIEVSNKVPQAAGWSRVTDEETLLAGGTFIFGYEATANSGVIVPMANFGTATTSTAGFLYSGSDASSGGSGTIDMSSVTSTSNFEVTVAESSLVEDAITIKLGSNYLGNTNTKNDCKLFAAESEHTAFTPSVGTNDVITLTIDANTGAATNYKNLKYNTGAPRFAVYSTAGNMVGYVHTDAIVAEVVLLDVTYSGATKYVGDTITASDFTAYKTYDTGSSSRTQITSAAELANFTVVGSSTLVSGENTITLRYVEGGVTVETEYVYNATTRTAVLQSIAWSQADIYGIDGVSTLSISSLSNFTATYDVGQPVDKAATSGTVGLYSGSGVSKELVKTLSNGHTWDDSEDGLYLGISYTEGGVTCVAYSGQFFSVERLNEIKEKIEVYAFSQATSENPFEVGDVVSFVSLGAERNMESSSKGNNILVAEAFTGDAPTGKMTFTIGSDDNGAYTFHNEDEGYLMYNVRKSSSDNQMKFQSTLDKTDYTTSWTIEFDENDNAVISSVYTLNDGDSSTDRTIRYNYNNGTNPRFCCYTNGQEDIQLFIGQTQYIPDPEGSNIANTNVMVQKAVLEYAASFNQIMDCKSDGSTTNVSGKWSDLSEDFDDLIDSFSGTDQTHLKALFQGADAKEAKYGGDSLQDMLARYEYIVKTYKIDDFISKATHRPPVTKTPTINPFLGTIADSSSAILISVISVLGVASVGGYFFLRRRKEI